jgi:heme-degrading monooxygenase HmoA
MIERHWKGTSKIDEADNYIKHLFTETFPQLSKIGGFKRASILKKETNKMIEFLIITTWESMEAIKKFAGENVNIAVVPQVVKNLMISYDKYVTHYEIVNSYNLSEN